MDQTRPIEPIKPIRVFGNWSCGYVLDYHTVSSTFVGHDEYGNPCFDTSRTPLGALLYKLKYNNDQSVVNTVVQTTVGFLRRWLPPCQVVVPIPPSRADREYQPVIEVSRRIAEAMSWEWLPQAISKDKQTPQLKDIHDPCERSKVLNDAFDAGAQTPEGKNVLLLDDLYESGATMNAVSLTLQSKAGASSVYVLALTRTRARS